jgi:hypothetical protein
VILACRPGFTGCSCSVCCRSRCSSMNWRSLWRPRSCLYSTASASFRPEVHAAVRGRADRRRPSTFNAHHRAATNISVTMKITTTSITGLPFSRRSRSLPGARPRPTTLGEPVGGDRDAPPLTYPRHDVSNPARRRRRLDSVGGGVALADLEDTVQPGDFEDSPDAG